MAVASVSCIQLGTGGSQPAAEVTGQGEVAFEMAGTGGAAIVVPVQINGSGPYRLILDTGATMTCLDQTVVEKLDLPKPAGVTGFGAGVGQSGAVSVHRVDKLSLGGATATDLHVCAIDLQQMKKVGLEADGLLGLNFLRSFKMTLDFDRNVLTLAE